MYSVDEDLDNVLLDHYNICIPRTLKTRRQIKGSTVDQNSSIIRMVLSRQLITTLHLLRNSLTES